MKKMQAFLLWIPCCLLFVHCKKSLSDPTATTGRSATPEVFETVIQNTFANYATFEQYWNYLYPWGSDHNGSARMYGSSTDHNHIYLDGSGVLTIKATRINWNEGNSSADPYLPIRYHSGAINAKFHVLVNDQFPNYEVRGEFQAPSVRGSWPAFWLTGVNSWPPESDIMEFKGNTNNWQNTFRAWNDVSSIITNVSSPGNWHTYRIWMQKSTATDVIIHYYIDGVWKGQHTANFVGKPMYIIINMQMEGSSGSPGPTTDTYLRARNIYVGRTRAF
ncbi:glycoside hydrolase [Longitalea arenae]|uniref:glycoside hydrolase n=1 Tax=Longitalea arenae TaxID=2812558 RepID=UPI001967DF86|nr:glycoside hydrolase [Longitalea arenae]